MLSFLSLVECCLSMYCKQGMFVCLQDGTFTPKKSIICNLQQSIHKEEHKCQRSHTIIGSLVECAKVQLQCLILLCQYFGYKEIFGRMFSFGYLVECYYCYEEIARVEFFCSQYVCQVWCICESQGSFFGHLVQGEPSRCALFSRYTQSGHEQEALNNLRYMPQKTFSQIQ